MDFVQQRCDDFGGVPKERSCPVRDLVQAKVGRAITGALVAGGYERLKRGGNR